MNNKEFMANIKKIARKAFNEYCKEVSRRMYWCYEEAIEKFYSSYEPRYYERTGMLLTAASNSPWHGDKYKKRIFGYDNSRSNEGIYRTRVRMEIDSSFIQGKPYNADGKDIESNEWVFKRSFVENIHGFTKEENTSLWLWDKPETPHINRWGDPTKWYERSVNPTHRRLNLPSFVEGRLNKLVNKYIKTNKLFDEKFDYLMWKNGFYK